MTTPEPSAEAQEQTESFSVPEGYQEKGWAKDIKSIDDLWKLTDNAQSLIGKRPEGIPSKDASDEEWNKFYKALGVPEAPDAYELKTEFEGLPEDLDLAPYQQKAKELAHNIGLTPEQANKLWDGYMNMTLEDAGKHKASMQEQQAELDKKFDELGNSLFGDSFKDVSEQAQKYLSDVLPDDLKPVVEQMSDKPDQLLALIHLANHSQTEIKRIKSEYGAEDKLQSGNQAGGTTAAEINAKLIEAKQRYAKTNVFSEERKSAEAEINDLREQLRRLHK